MTLTVFELEFELVLEQGEERGDAHMMLCMRQPHTHAQTTRARTPSLSGSFCFASPSATSRTCRLGEGL